MASLRNGDHIPSSVPGRQARRKRQIKGYLGGMAAQVAVLRRLAGTLPFGRHQGAARRSG
jgi:hypothetical protein